VQSVAKHYHVAPQSLASANHISVDTPLHAGQVLDVPSPVYYTEVDDKTSDKPQTPQQKTDAAAKAYQQALNDGENAAVVNQDRARFEAAVQAEINGKVADATQGVPPEYQTPTAQLIKTYGNQIAARYADKTVKAVAQGTVQQIDLSGQPAEVVQAVLNDPRVQQWIKQAAADVGKPYDGVTNYANAEQQAPEAAKRLMDTVKGLPPQLAAAVVQQSMPTIKKIAQCEMNYGGQNAWASMQQVVTALGDSPQAQALTAQIARAYTPQIEKWNGFATQSTQFAVGDGASPALAIAVAQNLKAEGKQDDAVALLNSATQGVKSLQGKIENDLKDYADLTKELNWLVKNAGPNLTKAQLQKAIDNYIKSKGPDFQNKLQDAENKIDADVRALKTDAALLDNLPPDLKSAAPGVQATIKSVLESDKTQSAIEFAASHDPGIFEGEEGSEFVEVLTELGHKSKDLMPAVAKAYVSGNVIPALSGLNPNDPASVARANRALDDFSAKASKLFGIPQNEVDENITKLRGIVHTLQTTKNIDEAVTNIHALDAVKGELGDLKESTLSEGAAGVAFRSVALGLSGAAFLNSAGKTIDDPNAQNVIGTLAYSVGLAQDSAGFAASVKLLDSEGALGKWGLAAGVAGEFTEKFIGALNVAYYAVGFGEDVSSGNTPKAIFDAAGAGGAALASFGEAVGLGSWAGPVGVGITVLAAAGIALVEWKDQQNEHSEAAEKFYKGAGIEEDAAKTLSSDAVGEANNLRDSLGLSAEQVQEVAEKHPELFGAPGYAQSVIDVVKACGLKGEDAAGFIDALAKDDPNYVSTFFNLKVAYGSNESTQPLSTAANLVDYVLNGRYPGAKAYLQAHAPDVTSADGATRRQADRNYEIARSDSMVQQESIANLLKGNSDPGYQAEIIKDMADNGTLDTWVQQIGRQYAYNGWPEAARSAIEAAQNAGVLSPGQAQTYLAELG
jgi:hypothetical protein